MAFDPNNPFAGGFEQGAGGLVRQAAGQGYFTPGGSQAYRMTMRRRLLQSGASQRQRAMVLAHLAGLSGIGQQQAMVDANQNIAGDQANALNNFDTQQYGADQGFFRGLLGQQLGHEDQLSQQHQAFLGGLGSLIGNLGIGYLTGGFGGRKASVHPALDPGVGGTY